MANQADRLVVGKYRKKAADVFAIPSYSTTREEHGKLREEMGVAFTLDASLCATCASPTVTGYLLLNITWSTISAMITTWRQLETIQPQSSRL